MRMPIDFEDKMKKLLKEEYEDFFKSYEENKIQGLRVNTLKIDIEDFLKINPFQIDKVSWIKEGFYYGQGQRPGKHPYHEAGLYYIQEPSAMAVGNILNPQPGEKILDLCAAPGGKSTHIAARLKGEGLLVSNELYPQRAKILSQNIERMGIKNTIVTNESPQKLSKKFSGFFNRILVDAPCSGEGMFRKDENTCNEWSLENVHMCSNRQIEILEEAQKMLTPKGVLLYSTCTFSPEENEAVIDQFLEKHPEFHLIKIHRYEGFEEGRVDWIHSSNEEIKNTVRLWPHKLKGEGHFIALLQKTDEEEIHRKEKKKGTKKKIDEKLLKDYYDFANEYLLKTLKGNFMLFKDQLYLLPDEWIDLEGIKVLRAGLHLGTLKKNRFEPSHSLALYLKPQEVKQRIDMNDSQIVDYLKGESIKIEGKKGWNLACIDGYSIGWGKISDGILKNHYPKGLRWV
ncbi:RsmF rRNA methyltransferase first C-terminal domain-containing protein [Inediibacterium massiliense]|uniref:RsmF rRNA methyltransferase first C-terminal domain-containing protein n=1 Tax=Inediibacterium massiliense TaxID=1658111 RepID=UPI0006B55230|nr:RsmF rRNA methyltransferase first C-terminal domain-containing protein [Inediibacterium massiliense]